MVSYKCEKCNKEFNQKSNYLKHINRKNSCILIDNNIIIYKCEKCNKEFNHKTNYLYHINKINSCNDINLQEKCNKLEIELFNLKNQNELLIEKNNNTKELENKNKELKEDNNILKGENKTLKELLNYKDVEIKDLYKNIYDKTKDNDGNIKIKLVQEYIYILRECDFVQLNKDIYKIGRTSKTNPEDRFQKYRKGTEIVAFFKVNNSIECENKMIKCFSNHTNIKKRDEYGKEYFQGDRNELLNEILQIVKNYNT
jgi:DNA-directed RNA polymerase subunit RPC12/RpoP